MFYIVIDYGKAFNTKYVFAKFGKQDSPIGTSMSRSVNITPKMLDLPGFAKVWQRKKYAEKAAARIEQYYKCVCTYQKLKENTLVKIVEIK